MTSDSQVAHADSAEGNAAVRESGALAWTQIAVAVCLMGIYVATVFVMFRYRGDKQWDRMVYLFSGYEAVVFVAVGAIFGTRIQRASVESANEHSRQARDDLRAERERADEGIRLQESADALARAIKLYAARQTTEQSNGHAGNGVESGQEKWDQRPGARGSNAAKATSREISPDLALIVQLADELFPQRRRG